MIKNSFIFLEGIGKKKEINLWKCGINNWEEFIKRDEIKGISKQRKKYYDSTLNEAKKQLFNEDLNLFFKFPSKERWRLYEHFKDEVLYLDIEIGSTRDDIILIGMFDGFNVKTMVKNYNMDKEIFINEIKKYKLLITYNGLSFDVPAIEKYFGIKLNILHVDLKNLCLRLGLKDGLKEVEKKLNLKRPLNLYGRPYDAYKAFIASGDKEYLELLIKYNEEDIVNLKAIMEYCYKHLKDKFIYFK